MSRLVHPGEVLCEEFMAPYGYSLTELAQRLGLSVSTLENVVARCAEITPEIAVLLAGHFDTSPQFWLNLQSVYDSGSS